MREFQGCELTLATEAETQAHKSPDTPEAWLKCQVCGKGLQECVSQKILGSLEDIWALLKDDPLHVERVSVLSWSVCTITKYGRGHGL